MYYECDKDKNTKCSKRICGKPCHMTTNKAYAKLSNDNPSGENSLNEADESSSNEEKSYKRKDKAVHEAGSVLPVKGMEEKASTDSST